jgi:hypothetical protein
MSSRQHSDRTAHRSAALDVWLFASDGVTSTQATATAHRQITKRFLNDPASMLRELLACPTHPRSAAPRH